MRCKWNKKKKKKKKINDKRKKKIVNARVKKNRTMDTDINDINVIRMRVKG